MQNPVLLKNENGEIVRSENAPEMGSSHRAYHEIPGLRHETRDVLKQLDYNVQLMEDLCGRLGFVLSEVRTLIRR
jgi:hypothetical protein